MNYVERLLPKKYSQYDTRIKTKDMKFAILCINRCLISMGDLARYKEMIFSSASNSLNEINAATDSANIRDYSLARNYYIKAMILAPKSSRAYHQLAILAVYTKRRLDACYYYFRCMEVISPLTSVRQSLNSIFEEARVRSDAIIKMITHAIMQKKKAKSKEAASAQQQQHKSSKDRVEIWYKPGLSTSSLETRKKAASFGLESENEDSDDSSDENSSNSDDEDDEESEIFSLDDPSSNDEPKSAKNLKLSSLNEKKLSVNELNKRFMLNYLNTIGKLFTKVGMETYPDVCSRMLHEFIELLRRKPSPLGKMRLIQITVINISIIDFVNKSAQANAAGRSQQLESAVQLSIDMFVLISKRLNYLISHGQTLNEWSHLLPSIKVFIDWMLCNLKLWYPLPDQLSPDLGPNPNRWSIIADMFNVIQKPLLDYDSDIQRAQVEEGFVEFLSKIKLEEDLELAGFVPLLSLPRDDYDYQNNLNSAQINAYLPQLSEELIEKARVKKRLDKLCLFAEYLCGLEQPVLKYDVINKCYSPLMTNTQIESSLKNRLSKLRNENGNRTISTCSSSSVKSSSAVDENENEDNETNDELNELKEKRRMLKAKMSEQQIREKSQQSLIEMSTQRRLELEIRPRFIVPDTNCFIDHLNLIDRILSTSYFIVIVPLLVINELDKLSKSISNCNDDSIEHAEYVQRNAKRSIEYLNEKFEKREKNIKALTSQGSVLETIQFRSEELKKQVHFLGI